MQDVVIEMQTRPIPKDFEEMRVQFSEYATHQDYIMKSVDALETDMKEVKRLVFQVKWTIIGGVAVVVAGQMGWIHLFFELLK